MRCVEIIAAEPASTSLGRFLSRVSVHPNNESHMTPAKLVASLPDSIRVGPYDMRIVRVPFDQAASEGRWGAFHSMAQSVEVMTAFPTVQKAVDTLLHELGHAIFWAYGLDDKDDEERMVSTFATAWTQVYRDNPWLLEWLKKALK